MAILYNCKWCGKKFKPYETPSVGSDFCCRKCSHEYRDYKDKKNESYSSSKSNSSPDGCGKIVAWIILILIIWAILKANGVL